MEKDKKATERKLLDALGEIIDENGLEQIGVNEVARRAGVSKMLIYRYFGSLDELIARYITEHDYWVNIPTEIPPGIRTEDFVKSLFREQVNRMRSDKLLRRLYRWELSSDNGAVREIRRKREENGIKLIEFATSVTGIPYGEVQALATVVSAAVTYLAIFGDVATVYNGIQLDTDAGWQKLNNGIDLILDKWL